MEDYNFSPKPPREALSYFRAKGIKPSFDFRDVWREEHATAFTVAKAMKVDVLESIHSELDRALAEGRTFAQFKKELTPNLQKLGWWGKEEQVDPKTGNKVAVQLGSPRRLKTIYQTNMRSARTAGQWQRVQRTKRSRPYLLYELGPSKEHREEHTQWSGLLLSVDDPFWQSHLPQNGWGCKCRVRSINKSEFLKLQGSEQYGTQAPKIRNREWVNRRTGEVQQVPEGIDPGFDFNPGQVARTEHAANVFGAKLKTARPEVGALAMENTTDFVRAGMENNYRRWVTQLYKRERESIGEIQLVSTINAKVISKLSKQGVDLETAAITLQDKQVRHLARPNKNARDHSLDQRAIQDLVQLLAKPQAILLDRQNQSLIYLLPLPKGSLGKAVVSIGYKNKGRREGAREKIKTNDIRTASIVQLMDIKDDVKGGLLELIEGKLQKN